MGSVELDKRHTTCFFKRFHFVIKDIEYLKFFHLLGKNSKHEKHFHTDSFSRKKSCWGFFLCEFVIFDRVD